MKKNGNSFNTASELKVKLTKTGLSTSEKNFYFHSFAKLKEKFPNKVYTLPFSMLILLENILRHEDGEDITKEDIEAIINWDPKATPDYEIQFTPGRVLLQDFTGVPLIADLAAMRTELRRRGGNPEKINPRQQIDLVIDHSVQVDSYGKSDSLAINSKLEFERNFERYELLKWAQKSFKNFSVVPPATGICHQINLENLSPVVDTKKIESTTWLYPDTVVGTDSHTPMVNGLGVLGWGVGGLEAEAAMLGLPCSMLIPQVVGVKLTGKLPIGITSTDLVLTITEKLRKINVVGKFVEYYGPGVAQLSIADRATVSNMTPEYGATVGLFPIDSKTIDYLRSTGRKQHAEATELYFKEQNLFNVYDREVRYSEVVEVNLSEVKASISGPSRPQDRCDLKNAKRSFEDFLILQNVESPLPSKNSISRFLTEGGESQINPNHLSKSSLLHKKNTQTFSVQLKNNQTVELSHGSILIAAVTSCTNTSNPNLMIGAAILARNALRYGLQIKPWVKTSFAPGSPVVTDYLQAADLMKYLDQLSFNLVGYGCTTCIGNSGPLDPAIIDLVKKDNLIGVSVLSGNRNFEARINPYVSGNYLMSPPLVVAYALVGRFDIDLTSEPLGQDSAGNNIFLKDIWPDQNEIEKNVSTFVTEERFERIYKNITSGSKEWKDIKTSESSIFDWNKDSTYIKEPPFPGMASIDKDFSKARILAFFGDSITTDHISPAGNIDENSPAGMYLKSLGVKSKDFNSYGARRGNHEIMWRGTFANVRIQNKLTPDKKGGWTKYFPTNEVMSIYDAAINYSKTQTPLVVIAGKEYGSGSSRDWAAKGVRLLGVNAILAESYERIHRSNLVGMGVAPLQFINNETAEKLNLKGDELISIKNLKEANIRENIQVTIDYSNGDKKEISMLLRVDTPNEMKYFRAGGVLPYIMNSMT